MAAWFGFGSTPKNASNGSSRVPVAVAQEASGPQVAVPVADMSDTASDISDGAESQVYLDGGRPPRMSASRNAAPRPARRTTRSESPAAELHKWWVTFSKVQFAKTLDCEKVVFRFDVEDHEEQDSQAIMATGEHDVDAVFTFELDPEEEMKAHLRVEVFPEGDDEEELAMASMALKESNATWVELMDEDQVLTASIQMRVSNKPPPAPRRRESVGSFFGGARRPSVATTEGSTLTRLDAERQSARSLDVAKELEDAQTAQATLVLQAQSAQAELSRIKREHQETVASLAERIAEKETEVEILRDPEAELRIAKQVLQQKLEEINEMSEEFKAVINEKEASNSTTVGSSEDPEVKALSNAIKQKEAECKEARLTVRDATERLAEKRRLAEAEAAKLSGLEAEVTRLRGEAGLLASKLEEAEAAAEAAKVALEEGTEACAQRIAEVHGTIADFAAELTADGDEDEAQEARVLTELAVEAEVENLLARLRTDRDEKVAAVDDLRAEKDSMGARCEAMAAEIEKFKAKQTELENERDAGLQKWVRESSEHEKLKARAAEDERQFRSTLNDVTAKIAALEQEKSDKATDVAALRTELEAAQQAKVDAEAAVRKRTAEQEEFAEALQRDMKDLNGKLRAKEKVLEEMQANSGEQVLELKQQVAQLEAEIEGKGKQLEASEAQLSALKADHEASKTFQAGLEADYEAQLASLRQENEAHLSRLEALGEEKRAVHGEKQTFELELETLKAEKMSQDELQAAYLEELEKEKLERQKMAELQAELRCKVDQHAKENEAKKVQMRALEEQIEATSCAKVALVEKHSLLEAELQEQLTQARSETAAAKRDVDSLTAKLAASEEALEGVAQQHEAELGALRARLKAAAEADESKQQLMESMEVKAAAMRREADAAKKKALEMDAALTASEEAAATEKAEHHQVREQLSTAQSEVQSKQRERDDLEKSVTTLRTKLKSTEGALETLRINMGVMSQKESSLRSAQSELNKLRGELKQKKAAAERAESALKQKLDLLNHKYEDATAKVRDLEVRLEQTEATLEETTEALSVEEERVRELEASSVAKTEHHTLKKYFHAAAAAAALLFLCLIISLATGGAGKGGGASEAADAAALEREYMSSISNLKSEHTELLEELSREKAALQLQVEAHSNSSTSHGQKVNELAAMVDEHKNECNALRQSLHTEKSEKEKLHKELHTAHEEQKQELVQTHQETVEMHESKIAELLAAHEAKHALLQATEDKLSRHLTSTAEAGRRLLPGEILDKGEFLRNDCESAAAEAACVEHYLEVTSNGNVVIYRGNPEADAGTDPEAGAKVEVWATKTARKPVKARFWHKAETAAEPHHEFRLRRDGVLIVVDTDRSKIMWKSTGKTQPKGNYRAFIDTEGSLLVELNGEVVWRNP